MKSKSFLLFLLLLTPWMTLHAAVVYLKDGSKIIGTVVSATAQDMELHTSNGPLKISSDQIVRVEYSTSEEPPVEPESPAVRRHAGRRSAAALDLDELPQSFSVEFGLATPVNQIDFSPAGGEKIDNGNTGVLFGTQYLYYPSSRVGYGFNLEFSNRSGSTGAGLVPSSELTVSGGSLAMMGIVKYSLTNRGFVRPYVLGGLGVNRTSMIVETSPDIGFVWSDTNTDEPRRLVNDSRWGLATTARMGLEFMSSNASFFDLEFGWTGFHNGDYSVTPFGSGQGLSSVKGKLQELNFVGRWGWRF